MSEHDMKLPQGKTCDDCEYLRRCQMLFGCKTTNTHCDFAPSRFSEKLKDLALAKIAVDKA